MASDDISSSVRKWVKPEDLNAHGTLFGGTLLRWVDEEAAIYAVLQLGSARVVTKYLSEIEFVSSARQGDLLELRLAATAFGRTSLTLRAEVVNMVTRRSILTLERLVFVTVDEQGRPSPHGFTDVTERRDRIPHEHVEPAAATEDGLPAVG